MRKFKKDDWIVRVASFYRYVPEGWKAKVLEGYYIIDLDGQIIPINDPSWELAEDTNKPAPIELIDGNAYMFDYHMAAGCIQGIYEESSDKFHVKEGWYMSKVCTNIRPMKVAESK
jgi:hypothetical protein